VLIDSNSVDRTRRIGERMGVPVYIHQEILPQHNVYQEKREALWKSLYVCMATSSAVIDYRHHQHPSALVVRQSWGRCCASRAFSTSKAFITARSAWATSCKRAAVVA